MSITGQRDNMDIEEGPSLAERSHGNAVQTGQDATTSATEVANGSRDPSDIAQDKIMKVRKENKKLVREKENLEDQLREVEEESRKRNRKLYGRCKELEAVIMKGTAQYRQLRDRMRRCEGEGKELVEARETIAALRRELHSVHSQQSDKDALLETRTCELRNAQALLDRTDVVSHADAIRMVENLNSEIYQLAALIPDSVEFQKARRTETELTRAAYEGVEMSIGKELVELLATGSVHHGDDPICVQIALQTLLTQFATSIITSWNVRLGKGGNKLLDQIHSEILLNEPLVISAKWRSLTRRYLRHMNPKKEAAPSIEADILGQIRDILVTSGVCGDAQSIHRSVSRTFGAKIKDIVNRSGGVSKAIAEDVASAYLQVIAPHSGVIFSSDCMEDEYGESRGDAREQSNDKETRTLCTTQLGLRRCETQNTSTGKGDNEFNTVVLLKSKVALESIKQEMMRTEQSNAVPSST
ncbi:hypothetical protein EW026_g5139 [Hermanssonia centrifuga]|uniref:Uncharacterized protein n=1 Tax=Hermanssonia centrifuga TaxID=98765 RepID=A0A4V3XA93_9APHY|nr:hypothetical protein EW026_g5139 [Hermanssonia centrifuga]